mgnify:CR=1 FL=1
MTDYTESVSGFKLVGSWRDIVAHGERVSQALAEIEGVERDFDEDFDDYNDWRPKFDEDMSNDISKKTAEKASMSENGVEEEAGSPSEEVKEAGKHMTEGTKNVDEPDEAVVEMKTSFFYLARALAVLAKKSMRNSEEMVYENMMTVLSPYYFDNELISANLKKKSEEEYVLEININDDELKSKVSDKMEGYEDAGDWTIERRINTDSIEDSEGFNV